MKRILEETPSSIVENGRLHFGAFRTPFREMNIREAEILGPRWWRAFRLKEWVGYFAVHPDLYFAVLIQDSKMLASATFLAFDRRTRRAMERPLPILDRRLKLADTMWGDVSRVEKRGYRMEFRHDLEEGRHHVEIDIAASRKEPAVKGELIFHEDISKVQPLVVCVPVGSGSAMYTHKTVLPAEGSLRIGEEEFVLRPDRDLATIDEHKAFYPRRTFWRWASFAAYDPQGRILGANLCQNVASDPARFNENVIWSEDRMSLLGPVSFEFNPGDLMQPWRIVDSDGRVELEFLPNGRKVEKRNLIAARVDYSQQFGRFNGFLTDDAGEKHVVESVFGVAEKMEAVF